MHDYLPLSFADDLEQRARFYRNEPAYIESKRRISHGELLIAARLIGSAIYKAGVRRQDRVGILSMNSIEFGEIMAATQWAGFILAPVNFRLAPAEIASIIRDGAPKLFFFEAQYLPIMEQLRHELPSVQTYVCIGGEADWAVHHEDFFSTGDEAGPPIRSTEEDVCCLIYTSGTTGKPKGVIWGHREYRQLAQVDTWLCDMQQPDVTLIVMPMFHLGGMVISLSQHVRGGAAYLQRQFEPLDVLKAIEQERLSILLLAPTMVQMVLDHPYVAEADLSSVRTIIYSAAPMPVPVLKRAIEVFDGCGFVNLFGQSEICMFCLSPEQHRPDGGEKDRKRLGSVGKPYPNLLAKVVDEDGNECKVGEPGEILARSSAMFRGYWNNHGATLETLRDGWCHTGDMGRFDEDGFLYLVDRKKDMIITGGENVYSREVEEALLQHPAVSECAVIGIPDPKWGENVCAVITFKTGRSASEAELIEHSRSLIASYKKPKKVIVVDALPKLVTGKVNKIELRNLYARA
ncbi:Long-chain-fatty-acid--CoA ligase [compost metagenome]|jgi:acyl-CoA synthetase (AMP-forming)/AMP-acid ligase II|uniref:class I adenylate-forming enzyme family protein n=1 Tax=Metapseudomonas furukawaii TaxID=1149133 RepID=UPI00227D4159|nr:AMP-binding protein [Pseudomonas furukawaii]WAG81102.1 AMP-binding protein [Pseudomonas furukawaii]